MRPRRRDNGSSFGGLTANTPWFNISTAIAMLAGRFLHGVPILALAGSLAAKTRAAPSVGTFPTHGPLFVGLLVGVIVIVGLLTYFPALALGPIVEHLLDARRQDVLTTSRGPAFVGWRRADDLNPFGGARERLAIDLKVARGRRPAGRLKESFNHDGRLACRRSWIDRISLGNSPSGATILRPCLESRSSMIIVPTLHTQCRRCRRLRIVQSSLGVSIEANRAGSGP